MANALITAHTIIRKNQDGDHTKDELAVPPMHYAMPKNTTNPPRQDDKYPRPEESKYGILSLLTQLSHGTKEYDVAHCNLLGDYYKHTPQDNNAPAVQHAWKYYYNI